MDNSNTTLEVIITDEKESAIKMKSKDNITLDQIKSNFQNEHNLPEEKIKNILFWYEDEDGDICYLEKDEDISLSAKEIYPNYYSIKLHSKIITENDSINDKSPNYNQLENKNNNENNKSKNENNNDNNVVKNEVYMKKIENQDKCKELLNAKNTLIESLQREISRLKNINKKLVEILGIYNQINVDNIYNKFDKLEPTILNKAKEMLQEIDKNIKIILNSNNSMSKNNKNSINENEIRENKLNENRNNENKNNENINNGNNGNVIEKIIDENNNNENITNGNKKNENIINENERTVINDDDNNKEAIKKEKKKLEILGKNNLQNNIFYEPLRKIFFNEDGTVNSKPFDSKSFHKNFKEKFKKLKKLNSDLLEYFGKYKFYILDPIIESAEIKSEEIHNLNSLYFIFFQIRSHIYKI